MTRLSFLLLGLVAAGLAASIARHLESGPAAPLPVSVGRPAAPPLALPDPADRSAERVAVSLARPLFSPDRRPAPPEASPNAAGGPTEPPRLTAILITPTGRHAIFASTGRLLVLQEGNRIGSYIVQTITAAEVTMVGPSGRRTLRPSYDPRTPGDPAAALTAELPFDANAAPTGLDILRNAARQASEATAGEPPAPAPTGILGVPPIR